MNSNGSTLDNPGSASRERLIRDHHGDRVKGYARPLGITNSFIVGLWTLRDGLIRTKDIRIKCLIVKVDALSVVQAMNSDKTTC